MAGGVFGLKDGIILKGFSCFFWRAIIVKLMQRNEFDVGQGPEHVPEFPKFMQISGC